MHPTAFGERIFEVSFQNPSWGFKANMLRIPDGSVRFCHPVVVSDVGYESEAERHRVRLGDRLLCIQEAQGWNAVLPSVECLGEQVQYLPLELTNRLLRGGGETLQFCHATAEYVCKDCHSTNLVEDCHRGDITCHDCGLVHRERVASATAEWRNFSQSDGQLENNSRVGAMEEVGCDHSSTRIADNHDALSRANLALTPSERVASSVLRHYRDVDAICESLDIPEQIRQRAKDLVVFAKKSSKSRFCGLPLTLAVIRVACVEFKQTRTIKDIAVASGGDPTGFKRVLKLLTSLVDRQRLKAGLGNLKVEAAQHVQRIVQHMQSSAFKFVVAAEHITRCAEAQGLCSSKGGNSVAAGAVYMAHLLGLKKEHDGALLKEVAACSGVHTDTVLRSYRDLQIFQIKN